MDLEETAPILGEAPPPVETPAPTSLADHEQQFPLKGKAAPAKDDEPPVEKPKHRAEKQKAKADDVPRIAELTKNWRTAEKERDSLKAELELLKAPKATEPKPTATKAGEAFPAFDAWLLKHPDQSYDDYTDARADFRYDQRQAADLKAKAETEAKAAQGQVEAAWGKRVEAAREKYDDFDAVAINRPTKIPIDSAINVFIFDDEHGADVLYHLQSHAEEVDRLLALGPLQQVKALTLLTQRLTTPPSAQVAVPNGATAGPVKESVPKPPTPLRTGPMRVGDEPPDAEKSSLAEHEAYYGRKRRA